jgi:hypothetical protein
VPQHTAVPVGLAGQSARFEHGPLVEAGACSRTSTITLDTYGHLFPDELDALAGRLEDARSEALATLARTQRGPAVVPIRKGAGR